MVHKSMSMNSEYVAEGRGSWPLGRKASAKAGPESSESDAALNNTSSSPKKWRCVPTG